MAFTLDATIGGATSNSFATRAEIEDIADGHPEGTLFTDLEDAQKDQYISTASLRLNDERYNSLRVSRTQALEFPRTGIFNRNYNTYALDEIPYPLQQAVFELIMFWLKSDDRIMEEMELHDAPMLDEYKIGPLSYKFNSRAKMDKLPNTVTRSLEAIGPNVWLGGATKHNITL